jgi:hypothetical protein
MVHIAVSISLPYKPLCSRGHSEYWQWILGNLFAPFLARQKIIQSELDYFSEIPASEGLQLPPGLNRGSVSRHSGPRHIIIEARKIRSIADIIPFHRIAASIPMTPALQKVTTANTVKPVAPSKGYEVGYSTEARKDHTPLSSLASTTPRVPRRSATSDEASPGNTLILTILP